MKCPKCKAKLKVQESRPSDNFTTIREYACVYCNSVYNSIEQLDELPLDREAQKRMLEDIKRFRDGKKSLRSE